MFSFYFHHTPTAQIYTLSYTTLFRSPVVLTGTFSDNMTAGRGWLALMLVIFGRWKPFTALGGALLFAYVEAFQFKVGIVERSEEHTSELQSLRHLVCRLLLEKKKKNK